MDANVVTWLAAATDTPPERVADELAEGERRRAFVARELVEAGLTGTELISTLVHLTGLDERQARLLLDEAV